jgi:peroxiredoxin
MSRIDSVCDQSAYDVLALEKEAKAAGRKLRVEVIADDSGKFCGNGLTFDTMEQALAYGYNLSSRWTLVRKFRVALTEASQ